MKRKQKVGRAERRKFTRSVAAAIVSAPLIVGHRAQPQSGAAAGARALQPSEAGSAAFVAAYVEVARARFGDKFSGDELERLRLELDGYARSSERLRAAKLNNGDEPDFVFRA